MIKYTIAVFIMVAIQIYTVLSFLFSGHPNWAACTGAAFAVWWIRWVGPTYVDYWRYRNEISIEQQFRNPDEKDDDS